VRRKKQGHQTRSGEQAVPNHTGKTHQFPEKPKPSGSRKTNSLCGINCYRALFIAIHGAVGWGGGEGQCLSISTLGSQKYQAKAILEKNKYTKEHASRWPAGEAPGPFV